MPKIMLSDGTCIKYKTIPLYRGVKIIDKEKSFENLVAIKNILEDNGIDYILAFGTLLGIVRDKDFISHDEDTDIVIPNEYKQKTLDALPQFISNGFSIARWDRRGLVSIMRNGEYTDLYFFRRYDNIFSTCGGAMVPTTFIENCSNIEFRGISFSIPEEYELFLWVEYGDNWRTPVQWADFEMKWWEKALYFLKMKIRDSMPDFMYFKFTHKAEEIMVKRYQSNMERYRSYLRDRTMKK